MSGLSMPNGSGSHDMIEKLLKMTLTTNNLNHSIIMLSNVGTLSHQSNLCLTLKDLRYSKCLLSIFILNILLPLWIYLVFIPRTSGDKAGGKTGNEVKKTEFTEVYYHVVLSPTILLNIQKDEVVVRFQEQTLGGWKSKKHKLTHKRYG